MLTIETERLRLRVFRPEDLNDYQAQIYGDTEVMRYLPGGKPRPLDKTRAVLDYFIEHQAQQGFSVWAVEEKASGKFVGHCGLVYLADSPDVELAYAFGQTYWGQGYAPEAAHASLRYGFEAAALPHILALAFPANMASQRVMRKIGMMYQGVTDQFHDAELVLYRIERADFQPGRCALSGSRLAITLANQSVGAIWQVAPAKKYRFLRQTHFHDNHQTKYHIRRGTIGSG